MEQREFAWPMFRRVWRRAALFEQMAGLLKIDLRRAARLNQGDAISAAHRNCLDCQNTAECRNWIEASEGLPLPPDFCPNKPFFARCGRQPPCEDER